MVDTNDTDYNPYALSDIKNSAEAAPAPEAGAPPEAPLPEEEAQPTGIDPLYVEATMTAESNGNANAVSHDKEGNPIAYGAMQFTPATWKDYGEEGKSPFDKEASIKAGTKYLTHLEETFDGDKKLASAAYNAGEARVKKLQKEYGPSYDDIEAHLPAETRKYVPKVLGIYEKSTAGSKPPEEQVAETPQVDVKNLPATKAGFAKALLPVVGSTEFQDLSGEEKAQQVLAIYKTKRWGAEANDVLKQVMTNVWSGADTKPNFAELIGPPPIVKEGENPQRVLAQWKSAKIQEMLRAGVTPAIYGDQLDQYLDSAIQNESEAFVARNRSVVGEAASYVGNTARETLKGAASAITNPIAGVTRLGGAYETADAIQAAPESVLGKSPRDYLYQTDDRGYLTFNADNTPKTKLTAQAAQVVGQVGAFLGGGLELKALGYGTTAIYSVLNGANALSLANDSFKEVYDETGSAEKAYKAAAFALPAAALGTLGDLAIISRWASPALKGLSNASKAKYIGEIFTKNAAVGAVSNVAMDTTAQIGEIFQTGKDFDTDRFKSAAIGGGLIGGVVGTALGARKAPPEAAPAPKPEAPPELLGLPAPEWVGRKALPGVDRKGLPSPYPENQGTLSGPLEGPPEAGTIPLYQEATNKEKTDVAKVLEGFRKSTASELTLTHEQASKIPAEFFNVFSLSVSGDSNKIVLTKNTSYIPKEVEGLPALEKERDSLVNILRSKPSSDHAQRLNEERTNLKKEKGALEAELEATSTEVNETTTTLVKERSALQKELDSTKAAYETDDDPIIKKIRAEDLRTIERKVQEFDDAHEEAYNVWQKVGPIQDKIDSVTARLKTSRELLNDNDIKAIESDLIKKSKEIGRLRAEAKEQELSHQGLTEKMGIPRETRLDLSQGVRVEGNTLVHLDNKWYVVDRDGNPIGAAHDFFHDALNTAKGVDEVRELQRTKTKAFVTKEADRTALSAADERAIEDRVAKAKAEVARVEALRKDTAIKGEEARNKAYDERVKKAKERLAREEARLKKSQARKKKTVTVAGLEKDGTTSLRSEEQVASATEETANVADTVEAKPLAPSSLSKDRRRISKARKPVTSNYTKPHQFTEKGTEVVRPAELFKAAQTLATKISKNTRIFTGGKVPENVLGFLNFVKDYVKVGRHGDVSTLMHELSHVIDRSVVGKWNPQTGIGDYSNIPKEVLSALKDMADTYYPASLKGDDLRIKEGIAMFFQHYATGQPVRQEALNWYKNQFSKEHPEVFKATENLKDLAYKYYEQTPLTYGKSVIVPKPNKFRTNARAYLTWNNIRDQWLSKGSVLSDIGKATGTTKLKDTYDKNYLRASQLVDQFIKYGPVDLAGNKVQGQSLKEAFDPAKGKYDILNAYLDAQQSAAYLKKGLEPGSNVADIKKIIDEVNREHPEVAQAASNYYDFLNRFHSTVRQASPEMAYYIDKLRKENLETTGKAHGFYVPKAREGFGGKFSASKKRTGSTRATIDPISNISDSMQSLMSQALKSEVKQVLVDLVRSPAPSSIGRYAREVTGQERIGLLKQLDAAATAALGPDATQAEKNFYSVSADPVDGITGNGYKVFSVLDGDRPLKLFEIDPRIPEALSDALPEVVNTAWFKYFYRPGAQFFRPMATSLRLAFQMKNLVRDPITLWRYVKSSEGGFKDALDIFKGYSTNLIEASLHATGIDTKGWVASAERAGALRATGAGVAQDVQATLRKHFGKNVLDAGSATLNTIENFISTPETAGRVTSYQLALKELGVTDPNQTLTPAQHEAAVLAFKRGTTNFADQGNTARVINLGVPFFTARIAELTRIPSDLKRNPKKMMAYGVAALGYGLYHALANKNEDWYQELTPEAKMNTAWYKLNINGVDKIMYVPLESWGALNFGIGQALGNLMNNDPLTPVGYYEMANAYFTQNISPINSKVDLLGPWGKEVAQQFANWDSYFRKDIVPPALQFEDPKLQYNDYTSELAKTVGALTNISPLRIDHAIRNTAPAVSDALKFSDQALGFKKGKEYGGLNFVTSAFSRSGTAQTVMDRSQSAFIDKLLQFRENKYAESPEEAKIRKTLERINKNVSDISIVMNAPQNEEEKQALATKRRQLLRQGISIALGEPENVKLEPVAREAKQLRKDRKEQQATELKMRRDPSGTGLLKGSTLGPSE